MGTGNAHLFGQGITGVIDEVLKLRDEIRAVSVRDITDVQYMELLNNQAQDSLLKVKLLADLFIGEVFSFQGKANRLQDTLDAFSAFVDTILNGDETVLRQYRTEAQQKLDADLLRIKP